MDDTGQYSLVHKAFVITHFEGKYILVDAEYFAECIQTKLIEGGAFKRNFVFYEKGLSQPQMFIFWVKEPVMNETKDEFIKMIGEGNYIDIFSVEDKLIVLLDPTSPHFSAKGGMMKKFFSPQRGVYR